MSVLVSFSLFFLSYFPLWLSVAFIDIRSICGNSTNLYTEKISLILIAVGILISSIIVYHVLNPAQVSGSKVYTIVNAEEEKTISVEYLLSYILPLFAFDFTHWDGVVLFMVFFATMAFLCIYHSHFTLNILLELLHYKFYKTELMNEDSKIISAVIISNNNIVVLQNQEISVRHLNNQYCCVTSLISGS